MLLAKLVGSPEAHGRLLAASAPDEPRADDERALQSVLGEAPLTPLTRVTEQADSLGAVLCESLGRSPAGQALDPGRLAPLAGGIGS